MVQTTTPVTSVITKAGAYIPASTPSDVRAVRSEPMLVAVYLVVTTVLLLRLALGLARVHRVIGRSERIVDRRLRELELENWLTSQSFERPQVRLSREVRVPVATGFHEVVILLPSESVVWSRKKLAAVLQHEMAHVRRGDTAIAFLGSLAGCLFWMHPLLYWIRHQVSVLAEEACDDAVVGHTPREQYAQILIELISDVAGGSGRLRVASSSVIYSSLPIKRRLERLFAAVPASEKPWGWAKALLVFVFFPALFLAAGVPFADKAPAKRGSPLDRKRPASSSHRSRAWLPERTTGASTTRVLCQ